MNFERNISESITGFLQEMYPNSVVNDKFRFEFYDSFEEEYRAFRKGVAIRNISANATIEMVGSQSIELLERITTNDIINLKVNQTIKTLFTNIKGGILGRTSILHFPERVLLLGNFQNNQRLSIWIKNFITKEDIQVNDYTDKYLVLELYGRQVESYLTILCGKEIDEMELNDIRTFNSDGYVFHLIKNPDAAGNIKYWIILTNLDSEGFIKYMLDSKSVFDVRMCGDKAFEMFRIEEGIPLVHYELNGVFTPHDAGLLNEVNLNKKAFIGHEIIKRKPAILDEFRLKGVIIENDFTTSVPCELFDSRQQYCGILTSFTESKLLNKNIAMGFFPATKITDKKIELFDSKNQKIEFYLTNLPIRK